MEGTLPNSLYGSRITRIPKAYENTTTTKKENLYTNLFEEPKHKSFQENICELKPGTGSLTPIILATQGAEIRRIMAPKPVHKTLSEKTHHKKGLV
jgi:hypothetical protein